MVPNKILKFLVLSTYLYICLLVAFPQLSLAQIQPIDIAPQPIEGPGTFGNDLGSAAKANDKFASIVSTVIGSMSVAGGIWFIFNLFMGAITWIQAAGDKNALQMAKQRITNAIIGLIIMISVMVMGAIIGTVFGFEILNIDITKLIR